MKTIIKNLDSIIFDLDGTLWNPTETCFNVWHKIMNEAEEVKEPITKKILQGIFGVQHNLIGEKLFPHLAVKKQNEIIERCYKEEVNAIREYGGQLYNNVEQVLKELKGHYKLYIVSNCQAGYIEAFLDYYNFHSYFEDFECSGNTSKSKGENIKSIIKRNNLLEPIYVGDTLGDYAATKESKIPFIFAEYGFGTVEEAEYRIKNIEGLKELLIEE